MTLAGDTTLGTMGNGTTIQQGIIETTQSKLTIGTSYLGGTIMLNGTNAYTGDTNIAKGTLQIGGGVALGPRGGDGIAKDAAGEGQEPLGRLIPARQFDPLEQGQDFIGLDFGDGARSERRLPAPCFLASRSAFG